MSTREGEGEGKWVGQRRGEVGWRGEITFTSTHTTHTQYESRETNHTTASCPVRPTHRPVVVEVTQLISEPLKVVRFESRGVRDDVVVGGAHRALTDSLTHHKEVVPSGSGQKGHIQGISLAARPNFTSL